MDNKLINWLLAGDPAVRYQLFKDILKADAETIAAERKQITLTGWEKPYSTGRMNQEPGQMPYIHPNGLLHFILYYC